MSPDIVPLAPRGVFDQSRFREELTDITFNRNHTHRPQPPRIPVDILIDALTLFKESEDAQIYGSVIVNATHVCREWRHSLLGISSLWAKIYVARTPRMVGTFFRRSGQAELDLTCLLFDFPSSAWIIKAIEKVITRTRSLHLVLSNRFDAQSLVDRSDTLVYTITLGVPRTSGSLRSFSVTRGMSPLSWTLPDADAINAIYRIFGPALAHLRAVRFNYAEFLSPTLQVQDIVTLELTVSATHGPVSLLNLWTTLERAPKLQTVSIECIGRAVTVAQYDPTIPRQRIILPRLRQLRLINPWPLLSRDLFGAIHTPASVSVISQMETFGALFDHDWDTDKSEHEMLIFEELRFLAIRWTTERVDVKGYMNLPLSRMHIPWGNDGDHNITGPFAEFKLSYDAWQAARFDLNWFLSYLLNICDFRRLECLVVDQGSTSISLTIWGRVLPEMPLLNDLTVRGGESAGDVQSFIQALSETLNDSNRGVSQLSCAQLERLTLEDLPLVPHMSEAVGSALADCMELRDSLGSRLKELSVRYLSGLSSWNCERLRAAVDVFDYQDDDPDSSMGNSFLHF